ncbi:hypothetical protein D9M72_574320 [compost metagenome]
MEQQRRQEGQTALDREHPDREARDVPERRPEQRIGKDALKVQEADETNRRRARHERLVGHRRPKGQKERRDQEDGEQQHGGRDHRDFLPKSLPVTSPAGARNGRRRRLLQSHGLLLIAHPPEMAQGRSE